MSTKKQSVVQLAPTVALCQRDAYTFLLELQRLIRAGYELDLEQMVALQPSCCIATVRLPEC